MLVGKRRRVTFVFLSLLVAAMILLYSEPGRNGGRVRTQMRKINITQDFDLNTFRDTRYVEDERAAANRSSSIVYDATTSTTVTSSTKGSEVLNDDRLSDTLTVLSKGTPMEITQEVYNVTQLRSLLSSVSESHSNSGSLSHMCKTIDLYLRSTSCSFALNGGKNDDTTIATVNKTPLYNESFGSPVHSLRILPSYKSPWHYGVEGKELENVQWVEELRNFLKTVKSGPVTLVSVEYSFKYALLNWLIGALVKSKPPVDNVLTVTYDRRLWAFLYPRKIPCIYAPLETLVKDKMYWVGNLHGMRYSLIVRVAIMRLLNYWGYDVANYDADAIILKNPRAIHEMYPDSDLIGQYGGSLPRALLDKWGAVMCMGAVILMRKTESTDHLWSVMTHIFTKDDQYMLNYGLKDMNISWTAENNGIQLDHDGLNMSMIQMCRSGPQLIKPINMQKLELIGRGAHGLKVTLVKPELACRGRLCLPELSHRDPYYLWHRGRTGHDHEMMEQRALDQKVWFLREDWRNITFTHATGIDWLNEITAL